MTNYDVWLKEFTGEVQLQVKADEATIAKSVEELKNLIVKRTPVGNPALWNYPAPKDYIPGQLKASWELIKHSGTNYTIQNLQPYAYRVETGWSTQAPSGMMRVSALSWNSIVKRNRTK